MAKNAPNVTISAGSLVQCADLAYWTNCAVGNVPSSGWRANEPAGLSFTNTQSFNSLSDLETLPWWLTSTTGTKSIATDGTAPQSPSNVLRQTYAAGFAGGSGGSAAGISTLAHDELYVCLSVKWDANWEPHPTGTNKLLFATIDDFSGGGDPVFINMNTQAAEPRLIVYLQGTDIGRVLERVTEANIVYGQYHTVELYLKMNTAHDASDGVAQMWVDGVLSTDRNDVRFYSDIASAGKWNTVKLDQTWGGSGGTVVSDFHLDHDEIFIGAK